MKRLSPKAVSLVASGLWLKFGHAKGQEALGDEVGKLGLSRTDGKRVIAKYRQMAMRAKQRGPVRAKGRPR